MAQLLGVATGGAAVACNTEVSCGPTHNSPQRSHPCIPHCRHRRTIAAERLTKRARHPGCRDGAAEKREVQSAKALNCAPKSIHELCPIKLLLNHRCQWQDLMGNSGNLQCTDRGPDLSEHA
ncbi:hypothetical protein NDU88_010765 [Pleurodeles waltl]|uniref:Secreted protein n=1 Tax=Pleurodeles waltl TaxID=8319 RepID=A0AAV7Q365_PLEWA|nr:hypothetical protein NDU88_010765 [Pleurodeles waltl]